MNLAGRYTNIKKIFCHDASIFVLLIIIFSAYFAKGFQGINNYWDWIFPYYADQSANYFLSQSLSWNPINNGSPLGYSSDYFFRFLVYLLSFLRLKPELLLNLILILISAGTSFATYKICQKNRLPSFASLIISCIAICNPVLTYKVVAGHVDYLFSYFISAWLIYFVLYKYKKNLGSVLTLSVLLWLAGTQLQFFILVTIFLILFFIFNKKLFSWLHALVLITVELLLNLHWLSNFIFGSNSVEGFSSEAGSVAFSESSQTFFSNVFSLAFSKATMISNIYTGREILLFSFLVPMIVVLVYMTKSKESTYRPMIIFWLILVFLATGKFSNYNLGFISMAYPMFREVGHFAPLIILLGLIILAAALKNVKTCSKSIVIAYLILFGVISSMGFMKYLPVIDYAQRRSEFVGFNDFAKSDHSTYRVLSYPFFNQYSFKEESRIFADGQAVGNVGWDSFSLFMGRDSINNSIKPGDLKNSLQFKFLTTGNVAFLQESNIKYIFDLSDIYESNYEDFAGAEAYDYNLSLIKNNPNIFDESIASGDLIPLGDGKILKVSDTNPRIYGEGISFRKINSTKYVIHIDSDTTITDLHFLDSYDPGWKLYPTDDSFCSADGLMQGNECIKQARQFDFLNDLNFLGKKGIFSSAHAKDSNNLGLNYNKWSLNFGGEDSEAGDRNFILFYEPQSYFSLSVFVSSITLIGILLFMLAGLMRKKIKYE